MSNFHSGKLYNVYCVGNLAVIFSSMKDGFQTEMRKILMVDRPDYDDPVGNRKHEPQKPGTGKT